MKKLILSIASAILVAIIDSIFNLDLPIECYVVAGFFVVASVLEVSRVATKDEKEKKEEPSFQGVVLG